jgi:hypothetical protein
MPTLLVPPAGHGPPTQPPPYEPHYGNESWVRRNSGLFGLLTTLLFALLIGLLIGHWVSGAPTQSVVKVEGLAAPVAAATTTPGQGASSTAPQTHSPAAPKNTAAEAKSAASEAKEEAAEAREAEAVSKTPAPPPVKVSQTTLQKLHKLKGKSYSKAIEKLVESGKPIETGG